jgi:hypothetical protein
LIEVSQEGCLLSSLGRAQFASGDAVSVMLEDRSLPGQVRWAGDGMLGVRFSKAFFRNQLDELVAQSRSVPDEVLRYGT